MTPLRFTFIGLSITSSWGNGHATTYRALLRALAARGHRVTFLERDVPWYADNRDLPNPPFCRTVLYESLDELRQRCASEIRDADVVVVGSYVPQGVAVGEWALAASRGITAFYDIDTPVTLAKLARGDAEYLAPQQIERYNLYLSFTGGPTLRTIEREYNSPAARALYCSVCAERYVPVDVPVRWDLGYLGTYSEDRQPGLNALLMEPAVHAPRSHFAVAGPQYPSHLRWPANVERLEHVAPADHPAFYSAQRFTLNITRADMRRAGYSPSVRLFEAAACGTPIISDAWPGLDELFTPEREILIGESSHDVLHAITRLPEARRLAIGAAARTRILREHTAEHRAQELEQHIAEALDARSRRLTSRCTAPAAAARVVASPARRG